MLIVIGPSCVRPKFVRAYAITLRISVAIACCAGRASHMPLTVQHVARPEGASPGRRCGVAAGRGVNADCSSTSTVTARGRLTVSLTSRVSIPGYSRSGTRKSWLIHSAPSWRVLTNTEREARLTQNSISTVALVSTVRVAANAVTTPPTAMMATRPAMTALFTATRTGRGGCPGGCFIGPDPSPDVSRPVFTSLLAVAASRVRREPRSAQRPPTNAPSPPPAPRARQPVTPWRSPPPLVRNAG